MTYPVHILKVSLVMRLFIFFLFMHIKNVWEMGKFDKDDNMSLSPFNIQVFHYGMIFPPRFINFLLSVMVRFILFFFSPRVQILIRNDSPSLKHKCLECYYASIKSNKSHRGRMKTFVLAGGCLKSYEFHE